MSQQLVHEAEAQRQHVRVALPAIIEINGHNYATNDWSVSGVSLQSGDAPALKAKKRYAAIMHFNFKGFNLSVPIELEVMHLKAETAGCRFSNQSERQISIMQLLVGSYVSGELIEAGDLLDVVARHNFTQSRKPPSAKDGLSVMQKLRHQCATLFKSLLVLALFGWLLFVVANGLFERLAVVKAQTATVSADLTAVKSSAIGTVQPLVQRNQDVVAGQALFTIIREDGESIGVDSPCNCTVKELTLQTGSPILKGQTAMLLAAADTRPYIRAYVQYDHALKLKTGQSATVTPLADGNAVPAIISDIRLSEGATLAEITLQTQTPLPAAAIDDPVDVRINLWAQ